MMLPSRLGCPLSLKTANIWEIPDKTPAEVYTGQPEATAQDEATTIFAVRVTGYSATAGLKLNLATDLS